MFVQLRWRLSDPAGLQHVRAGQGTRDTEEESVPQLCRAHEQSVRLWAGELRHGLHDSAETAGAGGGGGRREQGMSTN